MPSSLSLANRRVFRLLATAAVWTVLAACSKKEAPQEPLRSVKLITVAGADLNISGDYAGEVRAQVESRLGFQVAGKLVQRPAEQGQRVAAGQLLALIDAKDYVLSAQAAAAQVVSAQSQRDLALADFKRFEALKAQNFISGAELERREAALKAADAQLSQAKAQAQAQSNQAGYARLTASHSGVVTGVDAEVGQVVSAGQPVVRLAHDGPRDAVFAVPEAMALTLKVGQKMKATLLSTGQALQGQVRELSASADPVTRTYAVKLALQASERLPLGSTVNVQALQLPGSQAGVIKLPTSALRQEGAGTAVWVLDAVSMTVRTQPVQVGRVDGNEVVITSGLQLGQQVVSAGVHVLSPGQKVTIYNATGQASRSSPGAVPVSAESAAPAQAGASAAQR
ncbi:efflux RND transporter periplasmic adaptor subunit [Limnohabitans sp. G3-2]|uniref:efflux RND transporter periplasmic adaptor subunit n=1 Tax=Limnohabitans sp. G3-2 TaxID=1100711 RepID=UPI000C1EC19D|nr:efflux RND transporter periplasmic adaptor subunit [Limnohabitans sp. G3-2]PIT74918.1 efflux transporter periplasmic adaptor subunit [Limnohabitans sp. G3-2]